MTLEERFERAKRVHEWDWSDHCTCGQQLYPVCDMSSQAEAWDRHWIYVVIRLQKHYRLIPLLLHQPLTDGVDSSRVDLGDP